MGPEIALDGSNAGINVSGLTLTAADCLVREITIRRFYLFGIRIESISAVNNRVEGCYIGTNSDGSAAGSGNGWGGISVRGGGNTIGGPTLAARNLISGNKLGIMSDSQSGVRNLIEGNYIGVDRTGQVALGNLEEGIIASRSTTIKNNLISGNDVGVELDPAIGTLIQGNFIGTNAAGTAALGNGVGVSLRGSYTPNATRDNTIGGTTAAARNIISGNQYHGIYIFDHGVSHTAIQGNYIGTDFSGRNSVANQSGGIYVSASNYNMIGGAEPGARNVISGNNGTGVTISVGASNNMVQGNYVGVASDGTTPLGNLSQSIYGGYGIQIGGGIGGAGYGTDNLVGGTEPGAGNIVANGDAGARSDKARCIPLANAIYAMAPSASTGWKRATKRSGRCRGVANYYQNHRSFARLIFQGRGCDVGDVNSEATHLSVEFSRRQALSPVARASFFLLCHRGPDGSPNACFPVTVPFSRARRSARPRPTRRAIRRSLDLCRIHLPTFRLVFACKQETTCSSEDSSSPGAKIRKF